MGLNSPRCVKCICMLHHILVIGIETFCLIGDAQFETAHRVVSYSYKLGGGGAHAPSSPSPVPISILKNSINNLRNQDSLPNSHSRATEMRTHFGDVLKALTCTAFNDGLLQ